MRKLRHRGLQGIDGSRTVLAACTRPSAPALTLELLPSFQQETSNKKTEDQRPQNKNPGIQTLPDPV